MQMSGKILLILTLFVGAGAADARERSVLLKLEHEISGPAWKTWSLRLEANGKVVEERYDWSSKNYHSVVKRCRLTKSQSASLVEAAQQITHALPPIVDKVQFIALDGPYKRILIGRGSGGSISTWYDPEDVSPSPQARAFVDAWGKIEALLSCGSRS